MTEVTDNSLSKTNDVSLTGDHHITPSETLSISEIVEDIVQSAVKTAQEDPSNGTTKRKNVWRQRPKGQIGETNSSSDSVPTSPTSPQSGTQSSSSSLSSSASESTKSSDDRPTTTKKKRKITYSKRQLIALSNSPACLRPPKTMLTDCQRRETTAGGGPTVNTPSTPEDNNPRYRRRGSLTNEPHRVGGRKWAEAAKKDDEAPPTDPTAKVTPRAKDRYSSWRDREAEEAVDREGRRDRRTGDRDPRRPYGRRNDEDDGNTPEWFTADAKADFDLGSTVLDREADRNLLERGRSKSDKKDQEDLDKKVTEDKQKSSTTNEKLKKIEAPSVDKPKTDTQSEKDSSLPKALEKLSLAKEGVPPKVELEKISGASEEDRAALGRWFNLDQLQQLSQQQNPPSAPFGSQSPSRWKYPQGDYESLLMQPPRSGATPNPLSGTSSSFTPSTTTPSTKSENILSPLFAAMASANPPSRSYSSKWGFVLEDDSEASNLGGSGGNPSGSGGNPSGSGSNDPRSIFNPTQTTKPTAGSQSPLQTAIFKTPSNKVIDIPISLVSSESQHQIPLLQSTQSPAQQLPRTLSGVVPSASSVPQPRLNISGGSPRLQSSPLQSSPIISLHQRTQSEGLISQPPSGAHQIFTRVPPSPITTFEGVSKAFPFPPVNTNTKLVSSTAQTPPTVPPAGMGSFNKSFTAGTPTIPRQGSQGSPLVLTSRASPPQGPTTPGTRDKDDGQRLFRINVEDLFKTLGNQSLPPLPSMPAGGAAAAARSQQSPGPGAPVRNFVRQESPGVTTPSPLTGSFGSFSQPSQHRSQQRDHFPPGSDYEAEALKQLHSHAQQHHQGQFPSFKPRTDSETHLFQSHQQRLSHVPSASSQSPSRPDSDALASFQRFGGSSSHQKVPVPTTPIAETGDKSKIHDTSSFQPKPHDASSRRGFDYRSARSFTEHRGSTSGQSTSGSSGTSGNSGGSGTGPGFSPGFFPPAFPLHFPHSSQQHHHNPYQQQAHGPHNFPPYPTRKSHDIPSTQGGGGGGGGSDRHTSSSSGSSSGDFRGSGSSGGGGGTGLSINLPPSAPLGSFTGIGGARASPTVKDGHDPSHDSEKWGRHASMINHHRPSQSGQPSIQLHHQMHLPPMMPMNLPKPSVRRSTSHDSLNTHYPIPKFQGPTAYSAIPLNSQQQPQQTPSRIPITGSQSALGGFPSNSSVPLPNLAQFKKP